MRMYLNCCLKTTYMLLNILFTCSWCIWLFVTGFIFVVNLYFVLFGNSLEFQSRSSLASESTIQIPPHVSSFRVLLLIVFTLLQIANQLQQFIFYSISIRVCTVSLMCVYLYGRYIYVDPDPNSFVHFFRLRNNRNFY